MVLSKPQPNLNTTVGFDMKMTLETPPHPPPTTETQWWPLEDSDYRVYKKNAPLCFLYISASAPIKATEINDC